jgi:hypothetical protein
MTTEPLPSSRGLHVGAVVYCRTVCPPGGDASKAKDRRVIVLQLPSGGEPGFIGIVTATCRRDVDESQEVEIPHQPDGHPQTTFSAPTVAVLGWRHVFAFADIVPGWRRGRISSDLVAHINSKIQEFDSSHGN